MRLGAKGATHPANLEYASQSVVLKRNAQKTAADYQFPDLRVLEVSHYPFGWLKAG